MKITTLVENTTAKDFNTAHGLSFYVETPQHKLLFDVGPDDTIFKNAEKLAIDLSEVDTVILSHGHYDHGGALDKFLEINDSATIYAQQTAFEPYYAITPDGTTRNIGLNPDLRDHPQMHLLDGDMQIDDELFVFTVKDRSRFYSTANDVLLDESGKDSFGHEQNLLVNGEVLFHGCSHCGIINVLDAIKPIEPKLCLGGYHLSDPGTGQPVSVQLLNDICDELASYPDTDFYTCHCTGLISYQAMKGRMKKLQYIACGDTVEV